MSNLNPVWKVGFQVRETLKANGLPAKDEDVARVLSQAGLPEAEAREAVPARVLRWHALS